MDRSDYLNQLHSRFSVGRPEIVKAVEGATGKPVADVTRIIKGDEYEVHRVLLVDDTSVYLRTAFPGTSHDKVEREACAMARARENSVPSPEVLGLSTFDGVDGQRPAMIVSACPGRPLAEILPSLGAEQRSTAMTNIGRVLGLTHSVSIVGEGRSDTDAYLSNCLAAADQLHVAAFSASEIQRVKDVLRQERPEDDTPVLCHGDVSAEHVFVGPDLSVVGLIDWGMWSAAPAVAELAGLAVRMSQADYDAIAIGHGGTDTASSAIWWHGVAQLVGQMNWLAVSGQTEELSRPAAALRRSLTHFAGVR